MLFDLARAHSGVAVHFGIGVEARPLFFADVLDASADGGRWFFAPRAGDVAVFDGGDFDVEIDAIEKRAGNALAVTVNLGRAALQKPMSSAVAGLDSKSTTGLRSHWCW
jgi:hypothetical protein